MGRYKKLIGDYDSTNTFTVYRSKDNSGNDTFRIATTDDSTTGLGLLLLPILLVFFAVAGVIYIIKKYKENKEKKFRINKCMEEFRQRQRNNIL